MYGLMAGIANAYTGIQAGIDQDRERQAREEERALRREEAEGRRKDREFQAGQRQRTIAEQQRADQLRAANAAIPTTRTTQVEVDPGLGEDAAGNIFAQPPRMETRVTPVARFEQVRKMAENERQFGDPTRAMELDAVAQKEMWAEAGRRVAQLQATAGSLSPMQLAQRAAKIFNDDPFPLDVADIQEAPGGGVKFTLRNKDTGETTEWQPKDSAELFTTLQQHYTPESFVEMQRAIAERRAKVEGDLAKDPVQSVADGYVDKRTGRFVRTRFGSGEVIGHDEDGRPIYGPARGAGAGAGGKKGDKDKDPLQPVMDSWRAVLDSSGMKDNFTPQQAALGQNLARQFYNDALRSGGQIDPNLAVSAAIEAVSNPAAIRPMFNPATGTIVRSVTFRGREFVADDLGAPGSSKDVKPEELSALASGFLSSLPQPSQQRMVLASINPQDRQALRDEQAAALRSPQGRQALSARLGRQATEADLRKAEEEANAATQRVLDFIGNYVDRETKGRIARAAGRTAAGREPTPAERRAAAAASGPATDPLGEINPSLGISP